MYSIRCLLGLYVHYQMCIGYRVICTVYILGTIIYCLDLEI